MNINKARLVLRGAALGGALLTGLALTGCAVPTPTGPTVLVTPNPKDTPMQFQQQDAYCRQQAGNMMNSASKQSDRSATTKAVGGTVLGTAAGAILGAAAGNAGMGAAIGAGSGLLLGGGASALGASNSQDNMQNQYNINYIQCMTSYGNVYH